MSAQGRDWAIAQTVRGTVKAVLFMLGHHADPRGLVYRSQATIAEHTGFDVKTVRHALQDLEEIGLIRREVRMRPNGSRSSDHIHLNMAAVAVDGDQAAPMPGLCYRGVGAERPQGGGAPPPLTTFESFSESHLESRSDPDGSAPETGAGRIDFRKDLFEKGASTVQAITGRPLENAKRLVGSWRGLAGGDCAAVLVAIDAAIAEGVIEPVSWIEARLRRRRAELAGGQTCERRPAQRESPHGALSLLAMRIGATVAGRDPQGRDGEATKMALRGEWPVGGGVFVAADSPEGDAWEAHYRRLGQGTKWRPLSKGYGGMMPSAMPPGPGIEMAVGDVGHGLARS